AADAFGYYYCPPGSVQVGCVCGLPPNVPDPNYNKGKCPWCEGNPINPLVGNKYQTETDYTGVGAFPIVVERIYNSFGAAPGSPVGLEAASTSAKWTFFQPPSTYWPQVGAPPSVGIYSNAPMDFGWRLSYDRAQTTVSATGATITAFLYRSDSKARTFTLSNGVWIPTPGQLLTSLTHQNDSNGNLLGFTYVNENDETERYDANGKLLSITNRVGLTQFLQYDPVYNKLTSVTDAFGRQLTFTYNTYGQLSGMTDPNGGTYTYSYTSDGKSNLTMVTYPDGHTRQYLYENGQFVNAVPAMVRG
ncbi:MAG TPA: DUF6531 domain-containing protein, partial [Burkholderiaceae bacterium]|nr:DUF6531 domain-containing protein [Burkholderiaceae bacterium]